MKDIGRTKVREEIRFHQAMLDCLTHYQHTYCCKSCEKKDFLLLKSDRSKPLISNSLGSNSLVAETIRMKWSESSCLSARELLETNTWVGYFER